MQTVIRNMLYLLSEPVKVSWRLSTPLGFLTSRARRVPCCCWPGTLSVCRQTSWCLRFIVACCAHRVADLHSAHSYSAQETHHKPKTVKLPAGVLTSCNLEVPGLTPSGVTAHPDCMFPWLRSLQLKGRLTTSPFPSRCVSVHCLLP